MSAILCASSTERPQARSSPNALQLLDFPRDLSTRDARRLLRRRAIAWLVLASLVFYGWWDPDYLLLLLPSIGFNYGAGRVLGRTTARPRLQNAVLALAIAGNLALLFFFKYFAVLANWLAELGLGQGVEP